MVADVQLYEGRSLDIVQQAESLGSYGAEIAVHYDRYTSANAMVEAADRLNEAEGSLQQYLLLVGRAAGARRAASTVAGIPRLLPAARARPRRVGAELPGLRALRRAGLAHGRRRAARRHRLRRLRPARNRRASTRSTVGLLGALLAGDWAVAEAASTDRPRRRAASSPPTRSGTSSAASARCRTSRRETTTT